MWITEAVTKDGFELQFSTNHLVISHLLDHMLPGTRFAGGDRQQLKATSSRFISTSTVGTPLQPHRRLRTSQTGLICCSPTSCNAGWARSEANHHRRRRSPGGSSTELTRNLPDLSGASLPCSGRCAKPEMGALPALRAADPTTRAGNTADGFGEQRGLKWSIGTVPRPSAAPPLDVSKNSPASASERTTDNGQVPGQSRSNVVAE